MYLELDPRDVAQLDLALDSLEALHDAQMVGARVRDCLCAEAANWRSARKVLNHYKTLLGVRIRLLDRVDQDVER